MAKREDGERLGPYRILERLGLGGMGEVFLAYDPRLDRQVAIKRIRPDLLARDRQARFQREARLAARLRHSGIAQIHDLLRVDGVEHLVLEYVPGISLKQHLTDHPLPLEQGLDLSRQIAAALAHAHRQGVIHRDLKTENVLVTPEGETKIVDFGIAKEIAASPETALTREGGVPGTLRVMSPEQVRGETLEASSDLFSFGILLYELFTGRSPFAAPTPAETLDRILRQRPEPVLDLAPNLPPDLSDLIHHLLEKEPLLRPRDAGEVELCLRSLSDTAATGTLTRTDRPRPTEIASDPAATPTTGIQAPVWRRRAAILGSLLIAIALSIGLAKRLGRRASPPLVVAVMAPEVHGESAADPARLAFVVRGALLRSLVSLRGVSAVPPSEIDAIEGPPSARARAVAAAETITSKLICRSHGCDVELSRSPALGTSLLWSQGFEVPVDDLALVARAVEGQLRRAYPKHETRPGWRRSKLSNQDYEAFLHLYRAFNEKREDLSLDRLLSRLKALRQRTDHFPDVYFLESEVARYRYQEGGDPKDLEHSLDLARRAHELAPSDPTATLELVKSLIAGRRLAEAEISLATLESQIPGDARVLDSRARLLELQGHTKAGLQALARAAERQPSWRRLYNLAWMNLRHSRSAAARAHLERLLERAPGKYEGVSLLAQLELTSGDTQRAAELYADLVERSPGPVELSNLGLAHTLLGDFGAAATASQKAYDAAPESPIYALNLADSRWLEGQLETAIAFYRKVLELLAADPNPPGWQQLTIEAQARAHLGQTVQAVAAVQQALQKAPDNAQVAFEASLVFAVAGDRTAAVVNAEKALELGLEPRWFELPWFRDLPIQGAPAS